MSSLGSQQCCLSGESLKRDCRHDHAAMPHSEAWVSNFTSKSTDGHPQLDHQKALQVGHKKS